MYDLEGRVAQALLSGTLVLHLPILSMIQTHLLRRTADEDWRAIEQLQQYRYELLQEVAVLGTRAVHFDLIPQLKRGSELRPEVYNAAILAQPIIASSICTSRTSVRLVQALKVNLQLRHGICHIRNSIPQLVCQTALLSSCTLMCCTKLLRSLTCFESAMRSLHLARTI
jgi:hypothetical protein